ncbi:MAG: nucleotidyltransferase domain-containing protein [Ginsengibacter sp.]
MKFGLTNEQFLLIQNTLMAMAEIERVLIFGSRAIDNYRPSSDIDLVVLGKNISRNSINKISSALDDLPLPFMFDLLDFNSISNIELKNKIVAHGKVFFERELKSI